ncbi:putative taurine catabolism dioxygenase [Variovorax sp. CF313]|uniref:TauD/TfdA dioxygenase family protein n=1 Tax=Variovorax sp. CF313 TaxID=1144315 RepID=UPI000270EC2A|nr:TauD/TfdA family dioxygenase [Variovorax sp. CF313]EJL72309.1 putative taurine catabolism dioxygenase [Variovorax sp. CF313]
MSALAQELKYRKLHSDFVIEIDERINELLTDPNAVEQVRQLWQTAPVIIFRRQSLEEEEQVRFTELFGRCESANRKDIQSPYREEIIYFSTLRYADGRFVGGFAGGDDVDWHSDQTFKVRPATGAILYGVEVPKGGGDIYWADQYGAWDLLPADIQQLVEGRTGTYRYAKRMAIMNTLELKDKESAQAKEMAKLPDAFHPVVLTHPVTGRKALYADPTTLVSIEGLSEAENARVLPILFEAGGDARLVYRHKVHNGDLMLWDNGCTMHRRDEMQLGQPRLMKRTTFRLSADAHCVPH